MSEKKVAAVTADRDRLAMPVVLSGVVTIEYPDIESDPVEIGTRFGNVFATDKNGEEWVCPVVIITEFCILYEYKDGKTIRKGIGYTAQTCGRFSLVDQPGFEVVKCPV